MPLSASCVQRHPHPITDIHQYSTDLRRVNRLFKKPSRSLTRKPRIQSIGWLIKNQVSRFAEAWFLLRANYLTGIVNIIPTAAVRVTTFDPHFAVSVYVVVVRGVTLFDPDALTLPIP